MEQPRSILLGLSGAVFLAVAMVAACGRAPDEEVSVDGDAARGRTTVAEVGCGACHIVPGVPGARGTVGPSLAAFARRNFIAGSVPNEPATLAAFIRNAPAFAPDGAMPALPLSEADTRDIAAYLYTLH